MRSRKTSIPPPILQAAHEGCLRGWPALPVHSGLRMKTGGSVGTESATPTSSGWRSVPDPELVRPVLSSPSRTLPGGYRRHAQPATRLGRTIRCFGETRRYSS